MLVKKHLLWKSKSAPGVLFCGITSVGGEAMDRRGQIARTVDIKKVAMSSSCGYMLKLGSNMDVAATLHKTCYACRPKGNKGVPDLSWECQAAEQTPGPCCLGLSMRSRYPQCGSAMPPDLLEGVRPYSIDGNVNASDDHHMSHTAIQIVYAHILRPVTQHHLDIPEVEIRHLDLRPVHQEQAQDPIPARSGVQPIPVEERLPSAPARRLPYCLPIAEVSSRGAA